MVFKLNECIFWFKMGTYWKYNTIWDKVSSDIKKDFESKPVYNKTFLKIKIKSYSDETTDFLYK